MKKNSVRIGISLGDPAGVGPEVILKALDNIHQSEIVPVICGRFDVVKNHYSSLVSDCLVIESFDEIKSDLQQNKKYFFNIRSGSPVPAPGKGSRETGWESKIYIDKVVEMWKAGVIDAVVTGPVSKGLIERPDLHFTGHTEYIAGLLNEKNPYMLMYSGLYRVILVTTHMPLAGVTPEINEDKIYRTIVAGHDAVKAIDGGDVKLAIAGLDPHCGDRGAFGRFDMEVTGKAVASARQAGIDIEGPFAADTLFLPDRWKAYSLVVAHYHDQGLVPFKILAFDRGVNVTLGLPIIRTSPAHGTAFDIAGKGEAGHESMLRAIKLAASLFRGKKK
ncbi:MAG: 4-hydroxythreonine-4-phosphate dehydrogenase PdxA [Spirochaetes bacterium]|nr:4-hydroxythreonine-4-phosphate dehydrogenase PdxA [Spirochaetota bacterium]